jgi:AcrR family transcriptional regulator
MRVAETERSDFNIVAFVYAPGLKHAQICPSESPALRPPLRPATVALEAALDSSPSAGSPIPEFVIAADEARPARSTRGGNGAHARETAELARSGQRSRLLEAIVDVVARNGYPQTRIGDVASHAGVSRATFYELFKNKEECFLAAHRELAQCLSAETGRAVVDGNPTQAMSAVFTALVDFADREPLSFNFLTHEATLAGPNAVGERDRLIAALQKQIEHAYRKSPSRARLPDVPAWILLGGLIRVLGFGMRRGQYDSEQLLANSLKWVDCYRVPRGTKRLGSLLPSAGLVNANERVAPGMMAPEPLPRGRHRRPAAVVKRVQRERILHATAGVIRAKGYANTTVADIVAAAGLSREVFYSHFHGRPEAFVETHRLVFEQMMAATAGAFFTSSDSWPEQVWEGAGAFAKFLVAAPSFAHFGFVESYALGPMIAERTDDAILAFRVFLPDGYRYRPQAAETPSWISDAIVAATMETTAFYVRHDRVEELVGLLPLLTYVILAPFMGTQAARGYVEGKLSELQANHSSARLRRTRSRGPA